MDLLRKLVDIKGPSGDESLIRNFIRKEIRPFVDKVQVDKFGNLIASTKGVGPTIMITAHMDEIGLMVQSIDTKGLVYVAEIGGVEPLTMLGERVLIQSKSKEPVYGIVTTKDISDAQEITKVPSIFDLVIDTGLSKKELTKKGVQIGSYVYFTSESNCLGNKNIISGKALDDRIGCFILLEVAKKLKNTTKNILYVFTVQEEVGLYGAKTSLHGINPDWAVAIDVTAAEDLNDNPVNCMGKGPCLTIKDADTITSPCVNEWIKKTAKKLGVPLQLEVSELGTTDALNISVAKGGIPTSVLGVAVRNIHTAASIASVQDINGAIKILTALLKRATKDLCFPK
tara:strand:+ start:4127 stop:5152 length:1026 start_codon:yes stop_codon:yes gene_type:complete